MGAEQSTGRNEGAQPNPTAITKTCYYELLGLPQQATEEEIRRAYKKKALELHPDRNLHDIENATKKFAEVQTAYEILSDPQERAWYDSHRDVILSGGDPEATEGGPAAQSPHRYTAAAKVFDLMGRFRSTVPMNDGPGGFFGALNLFFDQLAIEETDASEREGLTPLVYPPFGLASDSYESAPKPFYQAWGSFSTRKSFAWRDKYRLSDAPDRRVRRLMEKENKKFRDEGAREFNDAVLSLVAFVKKRDPRYIPNSQSEVERQQILRNSAAAQAARSRAANQEKLAEFVVPEWARSRGDHDHEDEFSLSEEESEVEHIECVVCNKIFKSEKQFEAHEKSKKHVKAVQQLRRQMKKEHADFDLQLDTDTHVPPGAPTVLSEPEPQSGRESTEESDDEDYAPRSQVEDRLTSNTTAELDVSKFDETLFDAIGSLSVEQGQAGSKKVGKAKQKREKKAARQAAEQQDLYTCIVCKETFTSRSKLFSHIKELDHAGPVLQASKGGKKARR
ncbi:DnaJ-domain-containing protein [Thozetella sp. PMI_491]|nr:DnaJ-domain-containing protein [Thozetella sp. PMI_491]